jgi:hypothetical protein
MRRLLPALAGIVIVLAGVYGLMKVFNGRDSAGVSQSPATGPGALEPVNTSRPQPASGPPYTSAPHRARNVTAEGRLGADELTTALEQGNVVVLYPGRGKPPAALTRLQDEVSGRFDPELAAAGQMVILGHWPGVKDVQALAYRRRLRATGPADPRLRAFAEAWLGKGRGGSG